MALVVDMVNLFCRSNGQLGSFNLVLMTEGSATKITVVRTAPRAMAMPLAIILLFW